MAAALADDRGRLLVVGVVSSSRPLSERSSSDDHAAAFSSLFTFCCSPPIIAFSWRVAEREAPRKVSSTILQSRGLGSSSSLSLRKPAVSQSVRIDERHVVEVQLAIVVLFAFEHDVIAAQHALVAVVEN